MKKIEGFYDYKSENYNIINLFFWKKIKSNNVCKIINTVWWESYKIINGEKITCGEFIHSGNKYFF